MDRPWCGGSSAVMRRSVSRGLHEDPGTIDQLERMLWEVLVLRGMVASMPDLTGERVDAELRGKTFRVVHRHGVVPGSSFAMEPGFSSFQAVRRGQVLAFDSHGALRSPIDGHIFLPRYQDQGDDGFFLMELVDLP